MAKWLELLFKAPVFQSFTYKNPSEDGGSCIGKRARVKFGSRELTGFVINEFDELPGNFPVEENQIKTIGRIVDKEPIFSADQIELSRWLSKFYICTQGEALSAILPSGKREVSLNNLGLASPDFNKLKIELSAEQKDAVRQIAGAQTFSLFYLYGITGSGKTEVFLQAAEKVIERGKSVIYLVPEIGLTYQVIEDARKRFANAAAVFHSGLTGSEKLSEWMRIKRCEAKIIIGARSAVFAPVKDLGLIIIDEEHDSSYKSGSAPRYHARQTAIHIAELKKCPVVMGSATPSLEAWRMMESGTVKKLPLTKRLAGGGFPQIKVVPLTGLKGSLTSVLIEKIRETKNMGKQSIIFLNRRGFSHIFHCRQCGYEMMCKNCSVPMTRHKSLGIMKCHYCGWQTKPPDSCPECGSVNAGYAGFGTEFVEEEVRKTFPDCTVARLDTDSVRKDKNLEQTIKDFRSGKIDILLGTQMVAKGLNFPNVRLVGIAFADTGLQMPDFRAAERTFSLITQVAGRAGRYADDGLVIIQTLKPEHPAIVCAKHFDLKAFYGYELEQRRALDFPPFTRLLRLVFRSKDSKKAAAAAESAARILSGFTDCRTEIMGPAECMLAMIAGNYRTQILLRSKELPPLLNAAMRFIKEYKPMSGVYAEVDTDPLNML